MKYSSTEKYWSDHWENTNFKISPKHHPLRKWIEKNVSITNEASCFEFGCHPGKFLAIFGEKGYLLNGLDYFESIKLLPQWLKKQKYKVGNFYNLDFYKFNNKQQYDIVCSFGFVEHFKNLDETIKKHVNITKQDGLLIIEVPNLKSPLYYLLYKIFEPSTLKNHEISTMDIEKISKSITRSGCVVKNSEYIGYFYFRFVTKNNKLSKIISFVINLFRPIFEILPESIYKRYIIVTATKTT